MDLRRIEEEMSRGRQLEDILEGYDWKDFENICSQIFQEHGWKTENNFRFKSENRYEIDIVARKGSKVLCADCKHWGIRPGKKTQLRYAAEKQKERTEQLSRTTLLGSGKETAFHPMVITLMQEDIYQSEDVWIVPVFRLNDFLLNYERYLD